MEQRPPPQRGCIKKKSSFVGDKCQHYRCQQQDEEKKKHLPFYYSLHEHQHQLPKKVWFAKVELIEFPMMLGDNPTPDDGFPITIGWEPQRTDFLEIDYFEMLYQRHRHGMDLFLPASTRAEL